MEAGSVPSRLLAIVGNVTDEQKKLVEQNIRFVNYLVGRMHFSPLEWEDALAIGTVGLVQAANKYDSSMGSFTNYAAHRIRGSVKDAVRHALGREGRDRKRPTFHSLEDLIEEFGLDIEDDHAEQPDIGGEYNPCDLMVALDSREHALFYMNRMAGFPLHVLAARLGFSESWAAQLVKRAKKKLHARMHEIQIWHPS